MFGTGICIEALPAQVHEGMNTEPKLYAEAVFRFFLGAVYAV
nr:hypothetical protein [Petrachloros mirabilis]